MLIKIKEEAIQYIHDLRLLTPNARKYLLGSFFMGMTFASFLLLLNLYLKEYGFGEAFIGSVLSAGAIGMTLVSIPGAILLSRVRLKPVLLVTSILYGGFCLVMIYTKIELLIWVASFFAGIMMTFYRVASAPFFMRNSSTVERPYLFFLSFGIAVAAGVIGSIIFGNLVEFLTVSAGYDMLWSHRLALTGGVLFSTAAIIPFALLEMPQRIMKEDRLEFNWQVLKPLKKLLIKLTLPYFIVGTGAGLIIPFLNLFFRDRFGQTPEQIGYYFGLVNLTMFLGLAAGPILVRRLGMVRTMVFTQLASIPFMLILAFSYIFPLVFIAFLLRGALMNMGHPIGSNFAMEIVPKSHQGLVNAFLMFAWTSSWMVSTQIGGVIIEKYGYTPTLLIAVVLYVFSSLLYFFSFRKVERFTDKGVVIQTEYRLVS